MKARRDVLRMTAGLAAVTLAGCGQLSEGGDTPTGQYTDFVYQTDQRPLSVVGQKLGKLASTQEYTRISESETAFGMPATEAEYSVEVKYGGIPSKPATYAVLRGPVDFGTVRSDLEDEGTLTELDETSGFRTLQLETSDDTRFFGTDDRTAIMAESRDHFESVVEIINGNRALATEEIEIFRDLTEIIGDPSYAVVRFGGEQFWLGSADTPTGTSSGIDVDGDMSDYTFAVRYESAAQASANKSAVEEVIVEGIPELENVEVKVDGQSIVITARVETTVISETYS